MNEIIKEILPYIEGFLGGFSIFLLIVFFFPEKVQIWASIFWKLAKLFYKGAEKKYIAYDIQGRINEFNKKIKKNVNNYEPIGIKIQWIQKGSVTSFLQDNTLLVRIRKSENQARNFVVATMAFLSQVMLKKAKRYVSPTQKESVDLFVARKLFEEEKPELVDFFVSKFLIPRTDISAKIAGYIDKYSIIDKAGLFFPLFIQELIFLGNKVFGQKKESVIIHEVNGLIDFLKKYSERDVGDECLSSRFNGRYCHFGVMIIAKSIKVDYGDPAPYIKYLGKLIKVGIENIYIIGPFRDKTVNFIRNVCKIAKEKYNVKSFGEHRYCPYIKFKGKRRKVESVMVLLRKLSPQYYYDSESQQF